jgi:hypothetical protein
VHPLTSRLTTRRFIPWALGHRDTVALSRLQLFLYMHCDIDGSNTSLVPTRRHPDLPQTDSYTRMEVPRPAQCAGSDHGGNAGVRPAEVPQMLAGVSAEYRARGAHLPAPHRQCPWEGRLADLTIFIQEGEPIGLERVWS